MNKKPSVVNLRLIHQAQSGCKHSQSALMEKSKDDVMAYLVRMTLDLDLSEDLCQETMLEMIKYLPHLDIQSPQAFWGWVYKTGSSKVATHFRKKNRVTFQTDVPEDITTEKQPGPADRMMRKELIAAIYEAMASLKFNYRNVIVLRCFQQMSYADIASITGSTQTQAKLHFFRAKQALARRLQQRNFKEAHLLSALSLFSVLTAKSAKACTTTTVNAACLNVGPSVGILSMVFSKLGLLFTLGMMLTGSTVAALSAWNETQPVSYPPPLSQNLGSTVVAIDQNKFLINDIPTYAGRTWQGHSIEGLLMNARMVQGIFDDLNPQTAAFWAYPDTKVWDPQRNTNEFVQAMSQWQEHGLLAISLNLQGGSPIGYGNRDWQNSAFTTMGDLRPNYMQRLEQILIRADELGMVVILGLFYFGQDQILQDENAVIRATDNTIAWLKATGFRNVLIEINCECDLRRYDHDILKQNRVHELIKRVKKNRERDYRFLVGTSFSGGQIPLQNVVRVSDIILLHGNGVHDPQGIADMIEGTKAVRGYQSQPILFTEDDHYAFNTPQNNMASAIQANASWGYYDYRRRGEGYREGYQSVPVDWGINSPRKKAFFDTLKEVTRY